MLSLDFSTFPFIETNRLLLRNLSVNDAVNLFAIRTHAKVNRYLNRAPDACLEISALKIKEILALQQKNETILWVITLKDQPEKMIGNIGYWRIIKEHYRAEIGYMLHPDYWQQGIMKEALDAVIDYAFDKMNLHSIEANINPDNIASGALLQSCGFLKEAFHKENFYYDGVFYDSIIYSRLNNHNDPPH